MTTPQKARKTGVSKTARARIAAYRKAALAERQRVYNDLARLADVSYSMVDKYVNARRASRDCDRAFQTLTGKSPMPPALVTA